MHNVQSLFNAHLRGKAVEENAKLSRGNRCFGFFFSCKINTEQRVYLLTCSMQWWGEGQTNNSE